MAATEPARPSPSEAQGPQTGDEPLGGDPGTSSPRISTRVLVATVLVLVVLLLVSAVVAFVLLHQPRLTPVPVPSVSSIA